MMVPMRLRFAPSPTGQLHVGNARTALFNWLLARGAGGTFVLRVEDTDIERSSRQSEAAILEDLRWMGLEWTEGVEAGGDVGPYRQTERLHIYRAHTVELLSRGLAYRCFCTAEQLDADRHAALAAGQPPQYVGRCRDIPVDVARKRVENGEKAVIRFRVPADREVVFQDLVRGEVRFHTSVIGDPVLVRSDSVAAYNFAVVIDDALMGITHVIRGEDHISNTPRQILLYEAFGWTPPAFAHAGTNTCTDADSGASGVMKKRGRSRGAHHPQSADVCAPAVVASRARRRRRSVPACGGPARLRSSPQGHRGHDLICARAAASARRRRPDTAGTLEPHAECRAGDAGKRDPPVAHRRG